MLREFALVFSEYYAMLCYIIFARYKMQIFQEFRLSQTTVNPRAMSSLVYVSTSI